MSLLVGVPLHSCPMEVQSHDQSDTPLSGFDCLDHILQSTKEYVCTHKHTYTLSSQTEKGGTQSKKLTVLKQITPKSGVNSHKGQKKRPRPINFNNVQSIIENRNTRMQDCDYLRV